MGKVERRLEPKPRSYYRGVVAEEHLPGATTAIDAPGKSYKSL